MTWSVTILKRKSSASAMCSAHSATDHRSGACLKFHWASESPLVASRNALRVVCRWLIARSRSAWVSVCADATQTVASNTIRNLFSTTLLLSKCRRVLPADLGQIEGPVAGHSELCPADPFHDYSSKWRLGRGRF